MVARSVNGRNGFYSRSVHCSRTYTDIADIRRCEYSSVLVQRAASVNNLMAKSSSCIGDNDVQPLSVCRHRVSVLRAGQSGTRRYVYQAKIGAQPQMTITVSHSVPRGDGSATGLVKRSYNQSNGSVVRNLLRKVVSRQAITKRSAVDRMNSTNGMQRSASFNRRHSSAVSNQYGGVGRGQSAKLSLRIVWKQQQRRHGIKIRL